MVVRSLFCGALCRHAAISPESIKTKRAMVGLYQCCALVSARTLH